jgi:uncharacterized protein involved in outer membrane biogenesis
MTTFLISLTSLIGLIGFVVAIWSIFDTRNKYVDEYIQRKMRNGND